MAEDGKKGRRALAGLVLVPLLVTYAPSSAKNRLTEVLERGELRVVTREASTTYFQGPDGPAGVEYELARRFANLLGLDLEIVVADNVDGVLDALDDGRADLAAAGLTVTDARKRRFRFTPPYQKVREQVIYRSGTPRPDGLKDMPVPIEVVAGSSHAERLQRLHLQRPGLEWVENANMDIGELLYLVSEGVVGYAVADSNEFRLSRRYYPELRAAFDLTEPKPLAWAFSREADDSLYRAAVAFFGRIKQNGDLEHLLERYYGHVRDFDYVGMRVFQRHFRKRLPRFRYLFETAAEETDLDWRLLAAVAYQESHWDPDAVSPTGVRGLMMLTRATAEQMGVEDRTDPPQSIRGGARYLHRLLEKVPERIQEPDRLWLALAAYNIGFQHLEDARILTEAQGGNPDRWADVKERLPLLRKEKWYRWTEHGYARGDEAARYVENIRTYYDILLWLTNRERPPESPPNPALQVASPTL
ncbi:MAG TPA: membrane-bound lytic murein transglycosylase MltF [Gammaproteobacteria bacterium]|nr:membrane-bound lytic murein transglycosylase MltF [Gammaproteobacteria bacterium]